MFVLKQENCPDQLALLLETLVETFGDLVAVCYSNARGPWDETIKAHQSPEVMFSFLFQDGVAYSNDAARRLGTNRKLSLTAAVSAIRNEYFSTGDVRADHRYNPCAVILRQHAFIVLTPETDNRNLYVQIPGKATGHELLDDPQQLDREFPGVFQIA